MTYKNFFYKNIFDTINIIYINILLNSFILYKLFGDCFIQIKIFFYLLKIILCKIPFFDFIFNHVEFLFIYTGIIFVFTTLLSFICISYLGLYGVFILNSISLFLFWLSLFYNFLLITNDGFFFFIKLFNWTFLTINYKISFDLLIDYTSISFSFLTITIGLFVYFYAFSYFRYEPLVERLLLLLNFFMLSMVLLVSSGNLITMYLGWELIGLSSFFLINFWSTRVGTLKSAFKAFSFNKLSDFFLFSAILFIYNTMYCVDLLTVNNEIYFYENYYIVLFGFYISFIELVSLLLLLCSFIKSAQFGFHIWLPDSMEAPVPASALIHSATLVSAGIYLLLRFNNIIELSFYANTIISLFGSFTAFYGGIVSAFQSDTKKTLAYSTISHCGFLMLMLSTGAVEFTILYLYVHGFFKAATFLCIGNVNRFNRNTQDFRKMGHLYKYLPFECFCTFICLVNLGGLPLTLGFFIKHLLFISCIEYNIVYNLIYSFVLLGALSGIFYSYRLFFNIFFDVKKGKIYIYNQSLKNNYKSIFYTNTSLLSNISISILIFVSYYIILYLFSKLLNYNYNTADLKINYNYNFLSYYYTISNKYMSKLFLLNWVIVLLIFYCTFIVWRKSYYTENVYFNFITTIIIIHFFYLIINFLI